MSAKSTELTITKDDPFIQRYLGDKVKLRSGPPWTAEACRRVVSWYGIIPYMTYEPTWLWTSEMLKKVVDLPIEGDFEESVFDPHGPGVGVHIFEEPISAKNIHTGELLANGLTILRITEHGVITGHNEYAHVHPEKAPPIKCRSWDELAMKLQAMLKAKAITCERIKTVRCVNRRSIRETGKPMTGEVQVVVWCKPEQKNNAGNGKPKNSGNTAGHWVKRHCRQQYYSSVDKHFLIYIERHYRGNPNISKPPTVNHAKRLPELS